MGGLNRLAVLFLLVSVASLCLFPNPTSAQLRKNPYPKCPNLESIVRTAVNKKVQQTFVTIPATLRLFFHDCAVTGCDASVLVASTPRNKAEKDHPDNLSLAGDGFDTVIKAKQAVDAVPSCKNTVSCADILALATRDVVVAAGGPNYSVELGRFDGITSTAASVEGVLPTADSKVSQLKAVFQKLGLDETDLVALSGAHTVGFAHCSKFSNRIRPNIDRTLNKAYAAQLQQMCPANVDPRIAVNMDPTTPRKFDNVYFQNLQQGKGLFTSDQTLFSDSRTTKALVDSWATNNAAFNNAFVTAMTKLGRVGVKNSKTGNIRIRCDAFN